MKILLYPNLKKQNAGDCVVQTAEEISRLGASPLLSLEYKDRFSNYGFLNFTDFDEALAECDIIIAIGGDGTIIHAAHHAMTADKPVIGINTGRLGFLAGLEPAQPAQSDCLKALVDGDYTVTPRMMLNFTHNGKSLNALNDIVISRMSLPKILDITIHCDDRLVGNYRADGIIFSTPTGSTAYALSAGGPIIDPLLDVLAMTPICPHSLLSRSVLFHSEKKLAVSVKCPKGGKIYASLDGGKSIAVEPAEQMIIKKSTQSAKFISLSGHCLFDAINNKFLV
ncbi:MAG: NAD(+)/NADH kinase [Oscillospiraceae bacterium]|nr:NAD(+)/NADH kinase [Oscillospiraceae bacterium]